MAKKTSSKEDRLFNGLSCVEIALSMLVCWALSTFMPFRWVAHLSVLGLPLSVIGFASTGLSYTFYEYKGAFGKPFYVAED